VAVTESFADVVTKAYATTGPAIELGRGVHDGAVAHDVLVQVPLAMMNRHGLVAGATGTGKTKTLQGLAEQLSAAGVPVVVADIKGDLSGLAAPGATDGPAPKRAADLGEPFTPAAFPVEFLALGGLGPGVPVRATVTDFGPQLLAKVLDANETQEQSLHLVFRYADQRKLALLDLADLRAVLSHLESDEGRADLSSIGGVSPATIGVLLRALAGLEDGGGTEFFGEPQFDIADLMRTAADGRGMISSLELAAVQDKPALFSTALMWMVAELFEQLPEVGDLEKPKLVFFFDEAHLLFDGATDAFLQSVIRTVRLIRSKGVGVFFVTQSPKDVPADVLGQLGNRVQHALRAFTPDDAKALRSTVSTYPRSEFYDLEQLLTQLAIGEAVVTILSESGVPTPVVHTRMRAPQSRMSPIDDVAGPARTSPLYARYGTAIDAQSAREILAERMARSSAAAAPAPAPPDKPARSKKARPPARHAGKQASGGALGTLGDLLASSQGKAIEKEVVRGVFGMLKKRF
jgi:DNA double-strand break repair helicase HerA and related ATPase